MVVNISFRSFRQGTCTSSLGFWPVKYMLSCRVIPRTRTLKPQSHQAYDQVTTYLRPKNWPIVERRYDWSQRSYDWTQWSWVIARGKYQSQQGRWSCSKPSHTGLTTRLRPTCDRKMLQSWTNRRTNVRLVAEVVRLVAVVVDDRKGQISVATRSMVMFKT